MYVKDVGEKLRLRRRKCPRFEIITSIVCSVYENKRKEQIGSEKAGDRFNRKELVKKAKYAIGQNKHI